MGKGVLLLATFSFFVTVILGMNILFTVQHEDIHKTIYNNYGCDNVTISYDSKGGLTSCLAYQDMTNDQRTKANELNTMNEIVGYHLVVVLNAIMVTGLLISLVIILKED